MKNSWTKTFRRLAAGAVVAGATAFSSAMCYAQLAYDDADDPVYADGWQAGDNGGFGFTPWNFDSSIFYAGTQYYYTNTDFHEIDDGLQGGTHFSNPFNNIGRAWAIGLDPAADGTPRAGRGFAPLQVNQTLKVVIDNPTEREFFKGYFVRLNGGTGGVDGNICYAGFPCTPGASPVSKGNFGTFEYGTNGEWFIDGASPTGVFDTDTAAAGAEFSIKRTGANTYDVRINSFGGADFSESGVTLANPGVPIDWIEFTFFNTVTDTGTPPTTATDFYIRSMTIVPEPGTGVLFVLGAGTLLGLSTARRSRKE